MAEEDRLPQHSSKYSHPSDFGDDAIHPKMRELLLVHKELNLPNLHDEMDMLEDWKTRVVVDPRRRRIRDVEDEPYYTNWNNYSNMAHEMYLKNLKLYQKDPTNKNVENTLIHTMVSHGHFPANSLLRNKDTKQWSIPIPKAFQEKDASGGIIESIPLSEKVERVPRYALDRNGDSFFDYSEPLHSSTTKLYPNKGALIKAIRPYANNVAVLKTMDGPSLIQKLNALSDSDQASDDWIDPEMFPAPLESPVLAKVNGDTLEIASSSLMFFSPLIRQKEILEADIKETAEDEKLLKSEEYWLSKGVPQGEHHYTGIKKFLKSRIQRKLFADSGMSEEDRNAVSDFLGVVAWNYPQANIPVDEDGRAILGDVGSSSMSSGSFGVDNNGAYYAGKFIEEQSLLMDRTEPENWAAASNAEPEFLDKNAALLTEKILRTMQRMMKNKVDPVDRLWDPAFPAPSSSGIPIPDNMEPVDYMRFMDISNTYAAFGDGWGMQGSTMEETESLISVIAQLLEVQNEKAQMGDRINRFNENAAVSYKDDRGKNMGYNFRKRMGPTQVSGELWREQGGSPNDPIYDLIMNFIEKAEDYVVISGHNGMDITPVIDVTGFEMQNSDPNTYNHRKRMALPLRIKNIKLVGTDIEASRKLAEDYPEFKALGHSLKNFPIQGSATTKPIQSTLKVQLDKDVVGARAKDKNPEGDLNDDGVMDSKERAIASKHKVPSNK